MVRVILAVVLFLNFSSFGQNFSSFGQRVIIIPCKTAILIDSSTNCRYILDSTHRFITAYNSCNEFLWSSFACRNDQIYHSTIPVEISVMMFRKISDFWPQYKQSNDKKVIWINFDYCGGYIDLKTGVYRDYGCD